jgi:L-aspartate oxidase
MREAADRVASDASPPGEACFPSMREEELRRLAWDHAGLLRSAESLRTAIAALEGARMQKIDQPGRHQYELRNMHEVARLISLCALAREESRGGHYRTDFPEKRPEFQKHSLIRLGGDVRFADQ